MRWLDALGRPFERYADALSSRGHGLVAVVSCCVFVGVIVLGFVPVTRRIETSGYSTADLQVATTRAEVDTILRAFEPVMESVILLSVLDYVFVVAGFFLFFSLHSLSLKALAGHGRLTLVPKLGMGLTVVSRLLDSLENLWVILIYTDPDGYPTLLIGLVNTSEAWKWTVVGVEYPTLGVAIALALLARFTSLFGERSENPQWAGRVSRPCNEWVTTDRDQRCGTRSVHLGCSTLLPAVAAEIRFSKRLNAHVTPGTRDAQNSSGRVGRVRSGTDGDPQCAVVSDSPRNPVTDARLI
jgi:hypothetical protein